MADDELLVDDEFSDATEAAEEADDDDVLVLHLNLFWRLR